MIPKDLQPFVSIFENECVELIDRHVIFYPNSKILYGKNASLIVTNLRIIILIKNYEGLFFLTFIGYKEIKYEAYINNVVSLKTSGRIKTAVKIITNKPVYPWKEVINGIGFNSISQAHSFINLITALIEIKREKPKLEIIPENLAIKKTEAEIEMLNNRISETENLLGSLDKRFIMGDINEKNYEELKFKYKSILNENLKKREELNSKKKNLISY